MTWIDKLELGLKEDAAFRKDNLPERQVRGPEVPSGPGRSPVIPAAREDQTWTPPIEPATDPDVVPEPNLPEKEEEEKEK